MTRKSQENLIEILKEASAIEVAEASNVPEEKTTEYAADVLPKNENVIAEILTEKEKVSEALAREKLKTKQLENQIVQDDDIHELRKEYVPKLFWMIIGWLFAVALFVFLTAYSADNINNPDCRINCARFNLSDNVLIAFITTTTATVIGLFVVVAKWLFPSQEKDEKKEK